MFGLYKQSQTFIECEVELLGQNHAGYEDSVRSRLQHMIDSIAREEVADDDALALMQELRKPCCFSEEHRKSIGAALSTKMRTASSGNGTSTKQQVCRNIHEYWPETLWTSFYSQKGWQLIMEDAATFIVRVLGLRSPNDETVKNIVATVLIAQKKELSPDETYTEVHAFKDKVANKRVVYPGPRHYMDYPDNVADFLRLFPYAYPPDDPPVASKIPEAFIRDRMRRDVMPTRKTNARLTKKSKVEDLAVHKSPEAKTPEVSGNTSSFAERLAMHLLHGGSPSNPHRFDAPSVPKGFSGYTAAGVHGADPPAVDRDVAQQVAPPNTSTALPSTPTSLPDPPAKSPARPIDTILSEAQRVLDKTAGGHDCQMKKPSAAPSAANDEDDPDIRSTLRGTTKYHGGRIRYDPSGKRYQAFAYPGQKKPKSMAWPRKDGVSKQEIMTSLRQWIDDNRET